MLFFSGLLTRIPRYSVLNHNKFLTRLKWLSTTYYATFPIPNTDALPRRPELLTQRMMDHLEKVAKDMNTNLRVKCELKGGADKGLIRFNELDGTFVGELNYTSTQNAIDILRGPYDVGIPVGMNRKLLTWHPVSDVSYSGKITKIRSAVVRYIDI
jgi:hypothetical protein